MNNIFKTLCLLVLFAFLASCSKSDSVTITPPKPYAEQYPIDEAAIDDYLATHYYDYVEDELKDVETGMTALIDDPNLTFKTVERNDLSYKLYYLNLNEGDVNGERPVKVDSVFVSYKGTLLDGTVFDVAQSPLWFKLDEVIIGWAEIIPEFMTGGFIENIDGTINYVNVGKGIMFLPSAFGYYNSAQGLIPSYSPLIFNFNLIDQQHRDHDGDKVLSMYELFDADGNVMDTDGDGTTDYKDVDDDGDGFLTKTEITKPAGESGPSLYYPYNAFTVLDDPSTPEDESLKSEPRGIPSCSNDFTSPDRVRKYLDSSCH